MMEMLLDVGKKAVEHAKRLGAEEAEAFLYTENFVDVKLVGGIFASRGGVLKGVMGALARVAEPWIKRRGIPMVKGGMRAGVGVRAIVRKAVGFSSTSSLEEKDVLKAVEEAVKIAKVRPPDPKWASLPEPKEPLGQGGIFDERIQGLEAEGMLKLCADCCAAAGDFDRRVTYTVAGVRALSVYAGVVNTRGVEASDRGTAFLAFVYVKAKSGTDETSGSDLIISRTFTENLQGIAVNASQRAVECLGRKPLQGKHVGTVIFENRSWGELSSVILASSISALNVQEDRSAYKGRIGEQIAYEGVSVVDDGIMPDGIFTSKADDEGVPRQRTSVIEKGILKGFIYDNYSAKREDRESTGNASRWKFLGAPPYANPPTVRPSNLLLTPGRGSLDDLISEVKDGVLVKGELMGAWHSNVITGDFSVTATNAFRVKDGGVAYPLRPCTVAGNFHEALRSVTAIGGDPKWFVNVRCPSLIVENVVVST